MTKKMIVISGDKGGVGKSIAASAIIEGYRRCYSDFDLLIVEADGVVADVAERYAGSGIPGVVAPMEGDPTAAVSALVDHLAGNPADRVIVNLPASACTVIDPQAEDLLAPAADVLGLEIICVHVLSNEASSARLAGRSLETGLAAISAQRIALLNLHFGDPNQFAWSSNPARAEWLSSGGQEAVLPDLHQIARDAAANRPYGDCVPPAPAAAEIPLSAQLQIRAWLKKSERIVEMIEASANDSGGQEDAA